MKCSYFGIIVVLSLALSGCGSKESKTPELHSVFVTTAGGEDGLSSSTFAGVVEEDHNINLGFKTAGQISRIYVREGSHVAKGALLAELDAADYKLGVEALQIQYDQLSDEVARLRQLYEKKSVSANDYEKAAAGLRQLGVQLQVNRNKLSYTRLYAPVSGVIETVSFSPSEMVDAGTAVFTMLTDGRLEIVCDIPASLYLERDRIMGVTATASHGESSPLSLSILSIVPKADSSQLYRMRLGINGSVKGLTPGMNVEVKVSLGGEGTKGETLPVSAVFNAEGKTYVWLVKPDSTVTRREVVLDGSLTGSEVVAREGIESGAVIVRSGVSALHEGEKVKIIAQPSATNVGGVL